MRQDTRDKRSTKNKLSVRVANYLVATLLVLVPFHAFLTVWGSTFIEGSYAALRLWPLLVLTPLTGIVIWWLSHEKALRKWFFGSLLVRLALLYMLLSVMLGVTGVGFGAVNAKACALGLYLNLRFVLLFVLVMVVVHKSSWLVERWRWLLLAPGLVVALFAVLQYTVLPVTFLTHFGYGPDTIPAYSTINSNHEYIRVASTLRGPNPLGAYMVLIVSALAVSLRGFQLSAVVRRSLYLILAVMALLFSFSRSAWLGVVLALVVFGFLMATSKRTRLILGVVLLGFGLVSVGAYAIAQNNRAVQNAIFHTDDDSTIATSSNSKRLSAQTEAVEDAVQHPFGLGVGTVGPASNYNQPHPAIISENYFLQLAVEVGWPGLLIFLFMTLNVALYLWSLHRESLAMVLLMSLAGLTLVNLLSHAWTDETIAFTWWALAGIALGAPTVTKRRKSRRA